MNLRETCLKGGGSMCRLFSDILALNVSQRQKYKGQSRSKVFTARRIKYDAP